MVRFFPLQHRHQSRFAKPFFLHSDPWIKTLEAFAIYAIGFVAR